MSNPYTQVSVVNYNASPPADDDSQVASNAVEWQKHLDKIGGPLKTAIEAVDSNVSSAFGKILGNTITSQAGNYTLLASDQGKFLEFTATATLTLLAAATAGTNFAIGVVNNGTGTVTIDGATSETINGSTTITLAPNEGAILTCDGNKWVAVQAKQFATQATSQASNYTLLASDRSSFIEFTAGVTLTLLAAATAGDGFTIGVVNTSAADMTIDANSSETINGATTLTIGPDGAAILVCNGSKWIAHYISPATQAVQETGTSNLRHVTPGTQKFHASAVKAWVNFNGTGTLAIRSSERVTSVDDDGTGDYGVNLTDTFNGTDDMCVLIGHSKDDTAGSAFSSWGHGIRVWPSTTTTIEVEGFNATDNPATVQSREDYEYVNIGVLGDLA